MRRLQLRFAFTAAVLPALLLSIRLGVAAEPTVAARVTQLADAYMAEIKQRFPERATRSGLTLERHDGLTDNSQAALRSWEALEDEWAAELEGIDSAALRGQPEWLVLGFLREAVESSRQLRICRYDLWPVNQMSGWQVLLTRLAPLQPVGSDLARTEALVRWRKLPHYLANEVDNLRAGLRAGYSTPRRNVELVIQQLNELLAQPVDRWPLYSPAARDDSAAFRQEWSQLLSTSVKAAIERYRDYLQDEYLAKAREAIAVTANRNGAACYQASFRNYTTVDRPAEETYELGLREVERNQAAAVAIGQQSLQAADLPALLERLQKDAANRFESRDELLSFARAAVARASEQMPKWFSRIPKAQVVVEPIPDFLERTANEGYQRAAEDGSRPAIYSINLYRYGATTRSNEEIAAFHETYPGHHFQNGLVMERPSGHPITRLVYNAAFAEGWARYSEALAEEMGMYTSEHARADRRLWPARGMVIDPGIHMLGWTGEQAIALAVASGRFQREEAQQMVDRVAVWPGQLTAYDVGALEFFALRKQAQEALGDAFDIRDFHTVVLENGTLTLPMLREQVKTWLESKTVKRSAEPGSE